MGDTRTWNQEGARTLRHVDRQINRRLYRGEQSLLGRRQLGTVVATASIDFQRPRRHRDVLQLAGSIRGNTGFLGFALENACA
jgi:hypothetical protein